MLRESLLCAALMLVGCGKASQEDAFRDGLPTQEMVQVKAPEKAGQGLESGTVDAQAQGQRSDTYEWTRGATLIVNGGTVAVLTLLEKITDVDEGELAVHGNGKPGCLPGRVRVRTLSARSGCSHGSSADSLCTRKMT